MIKSRNAISMPEVENVLKETKTENKELIGFIHKFTKMKLSDAEKIKSELMGLDMIKINEEHIVKVIDMVPDDNEDLNKIFSDISLDDDEKTKILDIVKKY